MSARFDRRWIGTVALGVFACAAAGASIIALTSDYRVVGCESDAHYIAAQMLRCGERDLYVELYKSNWPWFYARLAGLLYGVFDETYLAAKAVSLAFAGAAVAIAMIAARRYGRGLSTGVLAALALVADGQFLYYGTLASTDMAAAVLFFAGLAALVRALDVDVSGVWSGIAGLAMGFACVTRYQYLLPSIASLTVPLWLFSGSIRQRVERCAAWLAGWFAPALLSIALGYATWSDAAGFRVVSGRGDMMTALFPPDLSATRWALLILAHYWDGFRLMLWHVGLVTAGALMVATSRARGQARLRRDLLAVAFVLLVLFGSVSWFTSLDNLDLRRVYLPLLLVGAVAFAAVFERGLAGGRRRWFVAALVVWALLGAQRFFVEFPVRSLWGERGYPVAYRVHPWNGLYLDGAERDREGERNMAAVAAGRELKRREDIDCRLVITNSVPAASVLPLTYACPEGSPPCFEETGMDNTAVGGLINHLDVKKPLVLVMEFPYRGQWHLNPDAPLEHAPGWSLKSADGPAGVRVYRLRPPP